MEKILKVCITGAAGQIAYSFIPLLLTGQVFGTARIALRLLDIPQAQNTLKGVIMEINDSAFPFLHSVQAGTDPKNMFSGAQVIVFLGGFPRKKGMQRRDLLQINKKIFMEQGRALSNADPNVKCLVIANPANTNAYILHHFSSQFVKKENITCLSRLDHNRAISQIASKSGKNPNDISGIVIFGNHSLTQYPSIETIQINSIPAKQIIEKQWLQNNFIESVQKRGGQILNARGNSSVFSAAVAVKDHLRDWYSGSDSIVSMGVVSEGDYDIPKGLWTSLPVKCKNFEYQIIKDVRLSSFCQDKIKITVTQLQQEIKDAEI